MDKTKTTKHIIAQFDSIKGIEITLESLDKSKILVTKGKYVGVLVFYQGFEDSINTGKGQPMELLYDKAQEMQMS